MSYSVSGDNLSAGIKVKTPSMEFKVSLTSGSSYVDSIVIPPQGDSIPPTTVYARLIPTSEGTKAGYITNTSNGATTQNVTVSGYGTKINLLNALANFGGVEVGKVSPRQFYTYKCSGLITDSSFSITAPTEYQISFDTLNSNFTNYLSITVPTGGRLSLDTVYVRFAPSIVGTKSDSIVHRSPMATTRYQRVYGRGVAGEPTIQASSITFSNVDSVSMTVSWSRPAGDSGCIVMGRCEGPIVIVPADGNYYSTSDSFGKGASLGTGHYVVYRGSGTSVTVRKLYGITNYHFAVFEYNGVDSCENYLTSPYPTGSQITKSMSGKISLTTIGAPYAQNFNSLDTITQILPQGWNYREEGSYPDYQANYRYAADFGNATIGNVMSYGKKDSNDRAFGGLLTDKLIPTISAVFTNNTGSILQALDIAYYGELWRLGTKNRFDSLTFEISTTAGNWMGYSQLTLVTPDTTGSVGARNGNSSQYRRFLGYSISGLNIPIGEDFRIRWLDFDASGSDDGLAIDDFTIIPFNGVSLPRIASTSPSDSATNVALSAPIKISFTDSMNTSSLHYKCNPDPGNWSPSWNGTKDTVTLNHNNFSYWTDYTFTVDSVKDAEGYNLLPSDIPNPFHFKTVFDPSAPPMFITVLDVGQAAATVIKSPSGKRVLIDAYSNKNGPVADSLLISQFLEDSVGALNTPYLDYLFLTHWDHDHAGYVDAVLRRLDSLNVASYDRGPLDTSDADFTNYKSAISARGWWGKRVIGEIGSKQTIDIGNGATIQIVCVRGATLSGDTSSALSEENNLCLGVLIQYGHFSMSITGDLMSQAEDALAGDFDSVNVMHVNHHGSAGSSTSAWINALNPQVSIISVGKNSFQHPTIEALQRLTSDPGGNNYIYQTERGDTIGAPDTAGVIPMGRGRITNRNIHIEVTSSSYKVDGDMHALAVEMSMFAASLTNDGRIRINWRTESEENTYLWEIERSVQTQAGYELIGTVPGHGTTSQPHDYSYMDNEPLADGTYFYRLCEVELGSKRNYYGPVSVDYRPGGRFDYALEPAYPNPFGRGELRIRYSVGRTGPIKLKVYNILGQEVRTLMDGLQEPGRYQARWDGKDRNGKRAANGIYFYRLESGTFESSQKVILLK